MTVLQYDYGVPVPVHIISARPDLPATDEGAGGRRGEARGGATHCHFAHFGEIGLEKEDPSQRIGAYNFLRPTLASHNRHEKSGELDVHLFLIEVGKRETHLRLGIHPPVKRGQECLVAQARCKHRK